MTIRSWVGIYKETESLVMYRKHRPVHFIKAVAKEILSEDTGLKVGCKRSRWKLDDWKPQYFCKLPLKGP